jgi:hypothetical protein
MSIAHVNFVAIGRGGPGNEQITQVADTLDAVVFCAVECLWPRTEYLTCHRLVRFDVQCEASVSTWNAAFSIAAEARHMFTVHAIAFVKVMIEQTVINPQSLECRPCGASVRASQSACLNGRRRVRDRNKALRRTRLKSSGGIAMRTRGCRCPCTDSDASCWCHSGLHRRLCWSSNLHRCNCGQVCSRWRVGGMQHVMSAPHEAIRTVGGIIWQPIVRAAWLQSSGGTGSGIAMRTRGCRCPCTDSNASCWCHSGLHRRLCWSSNLHRCNCGLARGRLCRRRAGVRLTFPTNARFECPPSATG